MKIPIKYFVGLIFFCILTNNSQAQTLLLGRDCFVKVSKVSQNYSVEKFEPKKHFTTIPSGEFGFGSNYLFSKRSKTLFFIDGLSIKSLNSNEEEREVVTLSFKDSQKYDSVVRITGISYDDQHLIFFIDRREKEDNSTLSEDNGRPLMLYPKGDPKSGFYLFNLKNGTFKKLAIQGQYCGWLTNETILVTQKMYVFPPAHSVFNIKTSKSIPIKKLQRGFSVEETLSRTNRVLVSYEHPKEFQIQFASIDPKTLNLTPITNWMSAPHGNNPIKSLFNDKIYTLNPIATEYFKHFFSYQIFENGKPLLQFLAKSMFIYWDLLSDHEIAIVTDGGQVLIFDILKQKCVFEIQL